MSIESRAPFRNDDGNYVTPYGTFRSVTTTLGLSLPKEVLRTWYAREAAKSALDTLPKLLRARTEDLKKNEITRLSMAAPNLRDEAADRGSRVHNILEARVMGAPYRDPYEDEKPYLWAWDNFVRDWRPEWEAVELTLCNPDHGWAGKADFHAWLPFQDGRMMTLGDYKTGKNVYPDFALQLGAYSHATVAWTSNGTEIEPPRVDRAVVVHLRPDAHKRKGYNVKPIRVDDEVYDYFRAAQVVADFTAEVSKNVVGRVIQPAAA